VARRAPNYVTGSNFDDRLAFALRPTATRGHDQRLSQGMSMPSGARARLKGDTGTRDTGWLRCSVQRINA
jgi:hypothetical protein